MSLNPSRFLPLRRQRAGLCLAALLLLASTPAAMAQISGDGPWADDANVQAVLAQRRAGGSPTCSGTRTASGATICATPT
jgi:hypothetical protein